MWTFLQLVHNLHPKSGQRDPRPLLLVTAHCQSPSPTLQAAEMSALD